MPRYRQFVVMLWVAVFGGTAMADAPIPGLALVGEARLTKYMFHIYDARLWAAEGRYDPSAPHALEIRYARRIAAEALTARTIDELRRLGAWDAAREQRWRPALTRAWPDVEKGDRLVAYAEPGAPLRIFHNGKLHHEFSDPEFGPAFFAIWLDPRSSEPKMRTKLLGAPRG